MMGPASTHNKGPRAVMMMALLFGPSTTAFSVSSSQTRTPSATPRPGLGQWLLDLALNSPLWKGVLVPAARQKIIDTAQSNGIAWEDCKTWLQSQLDTTSQPAVESDSVVVAPDWYKQSAYHAYDTGHLSWEAAVEVELASAAVGARNMPKAGRNGEALFRRQFIDALYAAGANVPDNAVLVDLGCATGTSTRLLAETYPQAKSIIGIDLSPYYIHVGKRLLELTPSCNEWICNIKSDHRIEYRCGDAQNLHLNDNSIDVVQLLFVAHEAPIYVTLNMIQEAHRILKPGGQLWFCEMDFQAPAYAQQRANPILFSLIRSTEPFLDEYADGQSQLFDFLPRTFAKTTLAAATGRHFAAVCVKGTAPNDGSSGPGTLEDDRFDENGDYRVSDTHLQLWDNKSEA